MVVGAGGCTADDSHIVILGNVKPDAACEYSVSPAAEMWELGYLDLAFGRPYAAHLLVENTGSDPVTIDGGWRNVWYEPSHQPMISNRGTAARNGILLEGQVSIPGGGRRIVTVDPLGDGRIVYKRVFEEIVSQGLNPSNTEQESSITIVLEGDADGTRVASAQWQYGLTVSLGPLVEFEAAADSADTPGADCCGRISGSQCEAGQNYVLGSCAECASCWPEVCNYSIGPSQCSPPLPGCGS